jgi:ATP phosphoribosyltransferase
MTSDNPKRTLRIAIQKKGRLSERSVELLRKCGLDFEWRPDQLLCSCTTLPLDVMLVRDDAIPRYVAEGICELGIVGLNVLEEEAREVSVLQRLGFGRCRLSLAVPSAETYDGARSLSGKRIATSYPRLLERFLGKHGVVAEIVEVNGSVEIAPALRIAEVVCDLVSTGSTLLSNGLREVETLLESEGVLIQTGRPLDETKRQLIARISQRIAGVSRAAGAKYVMMNAPRDALDAIFAIMPGMESPSILPLGDDKRVAIHAVAREPDFWSTIERLKEVGASSILVTSIEKIIE